MHAAEDEVSTDLNEAAAGRFRSLVMADTSLPADWKAAALALVEGGISSDMTPLRQLLEGGEPDAVAETSQS